MKLTTRERQQLAEIERRLVADEPRLHHALSRMERRSLTRRSLTRSRGTGHRCWWPGLVALAVLGASIVMLVLGARTGQVAVMWAGGALAQFVPLMTWWLLVRRRSPVRRSAGVPRAPDRCVGWPAIAPMPNPLLRPSSQVNRFPPPRGVPPVRRNDGSRFRRKDPITGDS